MNCCHRHDCDDVYCPGRFAEEIEENEHWLLPVVAAVITGLSSFGLAFALWILFFRG